MDMVENNTLGRCNIFGSGSVVASSNKDYRSMYPFNEFAKQQHLLIQSTRESYVSPLKDIGLALLQRHE